MKAVWKYAKEGAQICAPSDCFWIVGVLAVAQYSWVVFANSSWVGSPNAHALCIHVIPENNWDDVCFVSTRSMTALQIMRHFSLSPTSLEVGIRLRCLETLQALTS